MFCKNCGKEIKNGSAFCPECGAKAETNAVAQEKKIDAGAFQSAMTNSGETVAVKKKSKKKLFIIVGVIIAVIIAIAVCFSGSDVATVKNGSPYDYPDKTWGEALDEVCKKSEWDSFTSDDGDSIVEYNGVIKTSGLDLCIQFEVDDNEFEVVYMEVDGESCDLLETAAVIEEIFE